MMTARWGGSTGFRSHLTSARLAAQTFFSMVAALRCRAFLISLILFIIEGGIVFFKNSFTTIAFPAALGNADTMCAMAALYHRSRSICTELLERYRDLITVKSLPRRLRNGAGNAASR